MALSEKSGIVVSRRSACDDRRPGACENMDSKEINRRGFLTWLARGTLGAAAAVLIGQVLRFLSFEPPGADSPVVPLGLQDFAPGTLTYVAEARLYVGRDEAGLYAIDAVCTHLGCLVELEESGRFRCPCHGSYFDPQGRVQTGPTTSPLRHLALFVDDQGQLMVDRDRPVEVVTRLIA